jgi:hypothetical protein
MNRTPPIATIRELRNEVGFGCPIQDCANPYLELHHFDPAWSEENHHRPSGMIALCSAHHKKADGGSYTKEQLHQLKGNSVQAEKVRGQFDWLRNDLLAVVGGNFFHEVLKIVVIDGREVVWFRRDDEGYLRLNIRMLSLDCVERALIKDNIWMNIGDPIELHSPPQGKELRIKYQNGDYLNLKFRVLKTGEEAYDIYKADELLDDDRLSYPLTAVEVSFRIGNTSIEFSPRVAKIGGNEIRDSFFSRRAVGINSKTNYLFRENPSLLPYQPTSRLDMCPCGSGLRFKHCHGALG